MSLHCTQRNKMFILFTARRHASAIYAMALCLYVCVCACLCLCVCHKSLAVESHQAVSADIERHTIHLPQLILSCYCGHHTLRSWLDTKLEKASSSFRASSNFSFSFSSVEYHSLTGYGPRAIRLRRNANQNLARNVFQLPDVGVYRLRLSVTTSAR